jgi:hypothetical protein
MFINTYLSGLSIRRPRLRHMGDHNPHQGGNEMNYMVLIYTGEAIAVEL